MTNTPTPTPTRSYFSAPVGKGTRIANIPKTQDVDIVHVSVGLFAAQLLTAENVTAIAKVLHKLMQGKNFVSKDGLTTYRVVKVLAISNTIKMRVYPIAQTPEEEPL